MDKKSSGGVSIGLVVALIKKFLGGIDLEAFIARVEAFMTKFGYDGEPKQESDGIWKKTISANGYRVAINDPVIISSPSFFTSGYLTDENLSMIMGRYHTIKGYHTSLPVGFFKKAPLKSTLMIRDTSPTGSYIFITNQVSPPTVTDTGIFDIGVMDGTSNSVVRFNLELVWIVEGY